MKRLNLMFLIIGVAIIFSGCSKDDSLAPELNQNDQEISLKSANVKIPFMGTSSPDFTPPEPPYAGIITVLPNGKTKVKGETAWWYDYSEDDWRVTGKSKWYINRLIEEDGIQKVWGKTEIFVDGDRGKWEISWHGYLTPTLTPDGPSLVGYVDAVGQGKSGEVKGLVAKWTYSINFIFSDPTTLFYATEGYILEK